MNPNDLIFLLANKFRIGDKTNGGQTNCILTLGGEDFARATSAFSFLFDQITNEEYTETIDHLATILEKRDSQVIMPNYGDISTEALFKINDKIKLTELCHALSLAISLELVSA